MQALKCILYSSLIMAVLFSGPLQADSLFRPGESIYTPSTRQIKVGDIITVQIAETSSAAQEASTRTSKKSEVNTDFLSAWDQIASLLGNNTDRREYEFELKGEDDYRGLGQTTRRSQIQATITALVTEVLDSGNIFIVGEHQVKVNNEVETIRVSGIVRPQDVSPRNRVFSYQLAKAEVSISGSGVVSQKQNPGVLTRIFNWFF